MQASSIWCRDRGVNVYADFLGRFSFSGKRLKIRISADTEYVLYLNGVYAAHGQYADYPFYKAYDEIDLSGLAVNGENLLAVKAYHAGVGYDTHYDMPASLAFEVEADGAVILSSDERILSRVSPCCKSGEIYRITPQLGFAYAADLKGDDGFERTGAGEGFAPSEVTQSGFTYVPRPVKKCVLTPPLPVAAAAVGTFTLAEGNTPAQKMMGTLTPTEQGGSFPVRLTGGGYLIADLGRETAGYLTFDIEADEDTAVYVAYGEHLANGKVAAAIGPRNFAFEIKLRKGRNVYENLFRRMGLRYLELFAFGGITVRSLTVKEYKYPLNHTKKPFVGKKAALYETGRRTLELCIHEHYEDCPWREQALYAMDSRNQMLFGYGAFHEYEFPRASLRLLALSAAEDGLPALTAPARSVITIPAFALYWIIALAENARADFNAEFLRSMLPCAERIAEVFEKKLTKEGVSNFTEPRYWNFYEWCDGLDGGTIFRSEACSPRKEALNTALLSIAASGLAEVESRLGNGEKSEKYRALSAAAADALEAFFVGNRGLYASYIDENGERSGYHAYTQAAAILTGGIKGRERQIALALKKGDGLTDCTLATLGMKYEAIISVLGDVSYALADAERRFGKMLSEGATSYWETEKGAPDFDGAGSLCHAWSSVVCYLYDKYLLKENI